MPAFFFVAANTEDKGRTALNQGVPLELSLVSNSCSVVVGTFSLQVRNKRCAVLGSRPEGWANADILGLAPRKSLMQPSGKQSCNSLPVITGQ